MESVQDSICVALEFDSSNAGFNKCGSIDFITEKENVNNYDIKSTIEADVSRETSFLINQLERLSVNDAKTVKTIQQTKNDAAHFKGNNRFDIVNT